MTDSVLSRRDAPTRLLLDSDAVDLFVDIAGLLDVARAAVARGSVDFLDLHVVRDQLSATPDAERREALSRAYDALVGREVKSLGIVFGIARFGQVRFARKGRLESLATTGRGRMQDGLLAATAHEEADVLVTGDEELRKKARGQVTCEVWTREQLCDFLARP